jgi:hypothetical protein
VTVKWIIYGKSVREGSSLGWIGQKLQIDKTQPTKGAGTLRHAVRSRVFAGILGGRHMEFAYTFVDGTWNVPTPLTLVG